MKWRLAENRPLNLYEGERKFDVRIRYQKQYRDTQEEIEKLMVPTSDDSKIPLKEIADIKTLTGPAFIYRDNNMRYIAVKFSIRERDLGSTIAEAQEKVNQRNSFAGWIYNNVEW